MNPFGSLMDDMYLYVYLYLYLYLYQYLYPYLPVTAHNNDISLNHAVTPTSPS